jgi:cytochrome P450
MGLFTNEGSGWRNQRQLVQPAFHPNQITVYADFMAECTERRMNTWSDGDRIEIHNEMMGLTLEIVAQALLGVDLRQDGEVIGRNLEIILKHIGSVGYYISPSWAPIPANRRFRQAITELGTIVDQIIDERRANPNGDNVVLRLLAAENEQYRPRSQPQPAHENPTMPAVNSEWLTPRCEKPDIL